MADDPSVFKHFSAKEEEAMIKINITNTKNTQFCNGFLIALSDTIKEHLLLAQTNQPQENQQKVLFFIKGQEAAGAAVCLASCGLWGEQYCFETKEQENAFHQYHKQVKKAIEASEKALRKQVNKKEAS
jgi:hypothetical protein